jgi:hypothetical protein
MEQRARDQVGFVAGHRGSMKDFANASFTPDTVDLMKQALDDTLRTLPHPIKSSHAQAIAETILRSVNEGERDPVTLRTMALLELQLTPRE